MGRGSETQFQVGENLNSIIRLVNNSQSYCTKIFEECCIIMDVVMRVKTCIAFLGWESNPCAHDLINWDDDKYNLYHALFPGRNHYTVIMCQYSQQFSAADSNLPLGAKGFCHSNKSG